MKNKKYSISYLSGSSCFGWEEEVDTIQEVENIIEDFRKIYTAKVTVFDNESNIFIFYKNCITSKPEIDLIYNKDRDLRKKNKKNF